LDSFDAIFINDSPYAQAGIGLLKSDIKVYPVLHMDVPTMIRNALSNFENLNKIVCVNPQSYDRIKQIVGKSKSTFIPNGIPVTNSNRTNRNYDDKLNFLYVGRLENQQKGVLLIPHIANSLKLLGLNFSIDIIGTGPSRKELIELINHLQLQDTIILRGTLTNNEVNELMMDMHFLLMPSFYEGLPFVLLESMNAGMIPIVSLLPGNTDVCVKEGVSGFFGMPGNIESFVNAIIKAIESRSKLKEISDNAIQKVRSEFNSTKMFNSYLELIIEDNSYIFRNGRIDYLILPEFPNFPRFFGRALKRFEKFLNHFI
jgi:glycosyltransferase involved in cell wall biosynthesis